MVSLNDTIHLVIVYANIHHQQSQLDTAHKTVHENAPIHAKFWHLTSRPTQMQEMLSTQVSSSRCQRICYHKYVKVQISCRTFNLLWVTWVTMCPLGIYKWTHYSTKPMNVSNNVNNGDHRIILQVTGLKYQCMWTISTTKTSARIIIRILTSDSSLSTNRAYRYFTILEYFYNVQ